MTEIFWLQRIGNIGFCFNVGFWVCIFLVCFIAVISFFRFMDDDIDFEDLNVKGFFRWTKKFALVFCIFTIGAIMIPTQEDVMAIYGLGGTIDYLKSSDKAKELPDKVVDALTKYVNSIEKDDEK